MLLPAVDDGRDASPARVRPVWQYRYDTLGNMVLQVDPNRAAAFAAWEAGGNDPLACPHATAFAYDDHGGRVSRTLPEAGGVRAAEGWTYDPRGRTLTHTGFSEGGAPGPVTVWQYDDSPAAGGRPASEHRFAAGVSPAFTTAGVLTNANSAAERTSYGYDVLGRRMTVTEATRFGSSWATARVESTAYDPLTGSVSAVRTPEGTVNDAHDPATGRNASGTRSRRLVVGGGGA